MDTGILDSKRIVIFSADFKREYILKSKTIQVDGTFKTCPKIFHQELVIHGLFFESSFPLFYCLLKTKKEETYKKCLVCATKSP